MSSATLRLKNGTRKGANDEWQFIELLEVFGSPVSGPLHDAIARRQADGVMERVSHTLAAGRLGISVEEYQARTAASIASLRAAEAEARQRRLAATETNHRPRAARFAAALWASIGF